MGKGASEQFKSVIERYLEKRASGDELFAKSYHKDGKSLKECCDYIIAQVKKLGYNGFSDEEIFGFAVHYYDEDDLGDIPKINCTIAVNLSDHTKEMLDKKAEDEYLKAKVAKIEKREREKKEVAKKKAEQKKLTEQAEGQLNLFD